MKRLIPLLLAVILILPACTTQEGGENMAKYLYNGVELPDINTVWTDKETYPYAVIQAYSDGSFGLWLTSSKPYLGTDGLVWTDAGVAAIYACVMDEALAESHGISTGEWILVNSGSGPAGNFGSDPCIWSSQDILNTDGSVYLAASEPVPVGNDHVKHLSGDGMALYNGVMLPKLPDWDKETYPVAFIDEYDMSVVGGSGKMFQLSCIDSSVYWADGLVASSSGSRIQCYHFTVKSDADIVGIPYDGTWTSFTSDSFDSGATIALAPFWSNIDLLREDDSVYLPTSDPIPLDGMNVITWDGDTTGLSAFPIDDTTTAYLVSDYEPAIDGVVVGTFRSDGSLWIYDNFSSSDIGWTISNMALGVSSYGIGACVRTTSDGDDPVYSSLIAYKPASSDALDFSNTELSIYDPNVTANSADFAVDWTGLPVTTSNHVHYFLSGELDDGTQAANSPVYLFSSDVAEDGEHELIFQDLEPNTEYTVTARLLYNTTGERSDFTDSGVEATFDFTTLADGGFDRNSFLLGLASGLGKTAAMKADADHNAWAQGYVVGKALWKML